MFSVVICDDNKEYADYEKKIVESKLKILEITSYKVILLENGREVIDHKELLQNCNLLLMEVALKEENGINILTKIQRYPQLVIAIVSSCIDYALDGYKVNAFRYLLKTSGNFLVELEEVVEHAVALEKVWKKEDLAINFRERDMSFSIEDLLYVESKLHYTYFHIIASGNVKVLSLRNTLDVIEERLNSINMIRIHKSFLVNAKYIRDIRKGMVVLMTNEELKIAQGKYDEVMQKYARFKLFVEDQSS